MEQRDPRDPERVADTLDAASRRGFIGRSAELAAFDGLLDRPERVSLLWLFGPGGVGKTALMQAFAGRARQTGWLTVHIDSRTVAHSHQAFGEAVESALRADGSASKVDSANTAGFGPARPEEPVLYCRWASSRTTPVPSDTPGLWESICMINVVQWLATPRLSWSFIAIADLDRWDRFFAHIRQQHAPRADFSVGGCAFAVFVHDWRAEPPVTWLREMAERELTTTAADDRDGIETPRPIAVLSHPEFTTAVRQALLPVRRTIPCAAYLHLVRHVSVSGGYSQETLTSLG